MGTSTIPSRSNGQTIDASHPNNLRDAILVDFVPRNSSGVPTDIAGSLGSTTYRWLSGYLKKLYIGEIASAISIEESAAQLLVKVSGVTKAVVDTNGIDGAYMKTASILRTALATPMSCQTFTSVGANTWNVPTGVKWIIAEIQGAGGGGSSGEVAGTGNNGSGGGGGGSGQYIQTLLNVDGASTVTVTIGAGGAGGAVRDGGGGAAGSNSGAAGGNTSVAVSGGFTVTALGGNGVAGAAAQNIGGAAITPTYSNYYLSGSSAGGDGERGGTPGSAGSNSPNYSGGAHSATANKGTGGGGAASFFGAGGAGAVAPDTGAGTNGSNGSGHGSGGGGGSTNGDGSYVAGAGGNGANGKVIIYWV